MEAGPRGMAAVEDRIPKNELVPIDAMGIR